MSKIDHQEFLNTLRDRLNVDEQTLSNLENRINGMAKSLFIFARQWNPKTKNKTLIKEQFFVARHPRWKAEYSARALGIKWLQPLEKSQNFAWNQPTTKLQANKLPLRTCIAGLGKWIFLTEFRKWRETKALIVANQMTIKRAY